jgi:hypothetical protein
LIVDCLGCFRCDSYLGQYPRPIEVCDCPIAEVLCECENIELISVDVGFSCEKFTHVVDAICGAIH